MQDLIDIDGFGRKNEKIVGVIGGWLGQLVMVLNTIAKHYGKLDTPSLKSNKSSRAKLNETPQRPKTGDSKKSGSAAEEEEVKEEEEKPAPVVEHMILAPAKIQRFIYDYINEKLKVEKLSV